MFTQIAKVNKVGQQCQKRDVETRNKRLKDKKLKYEISVFLIKSHYNVSLIYTDTINKL